jgi:hypothetical protein
MKNYSSFINERVYYNSHGEYAPFHEIRELEVYDRENYTPDEFEKWQKKYEITDGDMCIWVTKSKKQAYTYLLPAQYHDDIMGMDEWEVKKWIDEEGIEEELHEIDDKDGFIIPESDDGDDGFLFVKR